MGLRYAVHAYAWTSSWSNDDLWIFDHAKELGLDAVEIPLMEPEKIDPAAIRERADAAGLDVLTSVALSEEADPCHEDADIRRRGHERLVECVDLAAAMGSSIMTGVVYAAIGRLPDRRPVGEDYERAALILKEVARHGQGKGVTIGIEAINRYETFLINTADQALQLCELVGEPNIGVHLDAYHMNIEEDDFYSATRRTVPSLIHFHLSESHRGTPGRGTVDWDGIMRALGEERYDGYVGLEAFVSISEAMRAATCIWRDLAPDSDTIVRDGLSYLKDVERAHFEQ